MGRAQCHDTVTAVAGEITMITWVKRIGPSWGVMACAAVLSWGWAIAGIILGSLSIATVVLAQAAASPAGNEPTHIQAVTGSVQGGVEMVKIDFDKPPVAIPTGFTVQRPACIALDFPGVQSALPRSLVSLNQGNLKSANVVQATDRTRVVLNLETPTAYQASIQGQSVLISLAPVATRSSAPQVMQSFSASQNMDVLPIKDIDFRRGMDDAGRIIVDLANNQVGVDIKESSRNLSVDFLKSSLPDGLRRRLDVSDFGTPVQTISTVQTGDRVHMTIVSKGAWEHSAYQSDDQLVIEIRKQKVDQNKLTQGPGYHGEKLSLNFQNIDIRALLQVIADFTNFNIIVSDTVQGNLTLRLKDVPWDQALDIILQSKSLGMRRNGNVIQIAPKEELAAKEAADLKAQQEITSLEPLRTESFQLNYAKASMIAGQLKSAGTGGSGAQSSGLLSSRGSVIAEPRTNQIFVSDVPSNLEQIEEMVRKLDVPVRQVLIEARIVEASDDWGRALGVKLGGVDLRAQQGGTPGYSVGGGNRVALGANYAAVQGSTNQPGGSTSNSTFISLPAATTGALAGASSSFAISLFNSAANRFLNLEIDALEADNKGRVISSPHVVTADQTKATISQGTQIPYNSSTSSGATAVSFQNAVLSLEVTPQITPEGNVILDLNIHKDTPNTTLASSAGIPIDTKQVQTQVLVENGGTVVIGGIYTLDESEMVQKVPLLGDIPILGNLFKNNSKNATKTEMLVFITPKILSEKAALQ
jgi:type IV pilus assembly protein PilQ